MVELNDYIDNAFGPDQVLPASSFKTSKPDGTIRIYKPETGPSSEKPQSVYTFFKEAVERYQDHPALVIERNGKWRTWSYNEYFRDACIVAKAFIKLGLDRFHGVCIMGNNSPEWMISSIGAIFAGGLGAGVYTTNSPEACFDIADNCKAQIVVVENEIFLDKYLQKKPMLPHIKAFIQWSGEPSSPGILSWSELLSLGSDVPDAVLNRRLSLAAVNQCCALIYTSGTTGPPKGVMMSQDQLTWTAKMYYQILELREKTDVILSYLPLSHLAAYMGDGFSPIYIGATAYFAPPDALKGTLGQWLVKVRPTLFLAVPRVWEKVYEKMQEVAGSAGFVKKSLGNWAKYHGLNYYNSLREGRELNTSESLKFSAARSLLLNKVKQALGLDRVYVALTGSAPISTEVMNYFYSLDIPIMEMYGLSESLSIATMSRPYPKRFKPGAVGKVFPITEITLIHNDELRKGEGEIVIRGRNVCMGYLEMPDKTDEAIDDEGWLHTGDLGWFDPEGFLYITGRLKELVITAGGENIPPVLIESAVKKELPCISNAMLIGDKRKYLTMLLTLKSEVDMDTGMPLDELTPPCQNWMREIGCEASTVPEAIQELKRNLKGPLFRALQQGIERYNNHHAISNAQKVQKWTLMPHDFSLPTEEFNNTLKLKRSFVMQKYADVIDAMYSDDSEKKIMSKL